jgi:hypothetical protein
VVLEASALRAIEQGAEVLSPHVALGDVEIDHITFDIPNFQRGLRWSENKRSKFLESIRQGLPIGTIVLARLVARPPGEERAVENVKRWYVLDGQQRIASLRLLLHTFWSEARFRLTGLEAELLDIGVALERDRSDEAGTYAADVIRGLCKTLPAHEQPTWLTDSKPFLANLCRHAEVAYPSNELIEEAGLTAATKVRTSMSGQYDGLLEYPVPALLLTPRAGSTYAEQSQLLTDSFTVLNDFIKLDKYEKLAADWYINEVVWPDVPAQSSLYKWLTSEVTSRISRSYEDQEGDVEYEPNVEETSEDSISIFDALYALSRSTSWRIEPGHESQRTTFELGANANDIAFDVVNLAVSGGIRTDFERLPSKLPRNADTTRIEIADIVSAYTSAADMIHGRLVPFQMVGTASPRNKKPIGSVLATTYLANQIMLTRESNFSPRRSAITHPIEGALAQREVRDRWSHNLASWWLRDTLSDEFQGSDAYATAARRVGTFDNPGLELLQQASVEEVLRLMTALFNEDAKPLDRAPTRRALSEAGRVLQYVAFHDLSLSEELELDHVVPYKTKYVPSRTPLTSPLPLNHVANWMPLERRLNAARKNAPWSDFISNPALLPGDRPTVVKRLLLDPSRFNASAVSSVSAFLSLMAERWVLLAHRCLMAVSIHGYVGASPADRSSMLKNNLGQPILDACLERGVELTIPETGFSEVNFA